MANAVEICVTSAASALAAQRGGADRVELCREIAVGGLTPYTEEVAEACALAIPVHVLVRPREGDFYYSIDEFLRMREDVLHFRKMGAAGVVLGTLHPDGSVDRSRAAELVATARPMTVTFHKAFDATPDPFAALDALIALGFDRVLTSGQAPTARQGLDKLAALVRRARGRIAIMAGGQIDVSDVPDLRASGIQEIHAGSRVLSADATDPDKVRALVSAFR